MQKTSHLNGAPRGSVKGVTSRTCDHCGQAIAPPSPTPVESQEQDSARATSGRENTAHEGGDEDHAPWTPGDVQRTLGLNPDEYQHAIETGSLRVRPDGLVCGDSVRQFMLGMSR